MVAAVPTKIVIKVAPLFSVASGRVARHLEEKAVIAEVTRAINVVLYS